MPYKTPEQLIELFYELPLRGQVDVMKLLMEYRHSDDIQGDLAEALKEIYGEHAK